jgi:hypothetical protein
MRRSGAVGTNYELQVAHLAVTLSVLNVHLCSRLATNRLHKHGAHAYYPIPSSTKILQQHLALPKGSPDCQALEHKHGKANTKRLIKNEDQTCATCELLDSTAQKCSRCQVYVYSTQF